VEFVGTKRGFDIWRTRDDQGRFRYGIARPLPDGTRVEPVQCPFYSVEAALEGAIAVEDFKKKIKEADEQRVDGETG